MFAFDFDGVIHNSVEAKTKAFLSVYEAEASESQLNEIRKYHELNGGINRKLKFEYFEKNIFNRDFDESILLKLCIKFENALAEMLAKVPIEQTAKKLIFELKKKQYLLTIVSGAPGNEIKQILRKEGLEDLFVEVLDGTSPKQKHLNYLMNHYGLSQNEIVFMGDSMTDYIAAKDVNIPFIAINANFDQTEYELMRKKSLGELHQGLSEILEEARKSI